jgi:Flp pilus assembly protein TadG
MFAMLLPALLGMTGLVVDTGVMLIRHRQVQNAADAAAMAAAMDKYRGATDNVALASANTFLANNGISSVSLSLNGASNTLNIPPSQGPYAGNAQYAEVMITKTVQTSFIHALGINQNQQITARAVAGYEPVGSGEGAIVLDPTAAPGISVQGNNTLLIVNGTVVVNSMGGGVDQWGDPVSGSHTAVATSSNPSIIARDLQVVGGVDTLNNIRAYDSGFSPLPYDPSNTDRPLFARAPLAPDPLATLPTPTSSNGVENTFWNKAGVAQGSAQDINIGNGDTVTLKPGIYKTISITGGNVTLNSGIYVVGVNGTGGGNRFNINGGVVNGSGVLIYNTGSDYTATNPPDASDGEALPNAPNSTKFGSFSVNGGQINLTPISDANSPFYGVLFYQRRWNTTSANIAGNSSNFNVSGTIYAKWTNFQLAGQGVYNAQFVVGSMSLSGNATMTINATGKNFGRANLVFLVE